MLEDVFVEIDTNILENYVSEENLLDNYVKILTNLSLEGELVGKKHKKSRKNKKNRKNKNKV